MKLLVFAHTPPPHHGQSLMVQLMVEGFGGDARLLPPKEERAIECYHVNCRFSEGMEDIGAVRFGKLFSLFRYCMEAIWCRFRYGVRTLYYVPAPGKKSALYRDWLAMFLCRPFFPNLILHWHASGLGDWLDQKGSRMERAITRALLGRPALSIALANASSRDAGWMRSRKVAIVPNGLPDPCPEFAAEVLPARKARYEARKRCIEAPEPAAETPLVFRAIYLAHCIRDKGLFDSLDGIALFNQLQSRIVVHLTVAGAFMNEKEEQEFRTRIAQPDLAGAVTYAGFLSGPEKANALKQSDILCFPTYYTAESFPLTIVEAMAFGIPPVATRWRAIPEMLPADYPVYVDPKSPAQIADAFERLAGADLAEALREHYLAHLSEKSHLQQLAAAMQEIEKADEPGLIA